MKKLALSFVIGIGLYILLGFTFHVKASAATVYVAGNSTGNDTRTKEQAQNSSTPWQTIQKATDESEAGDIINVKGGITYSNTNLCIGEATAIACIGFESASGTEEAPITFQAWPGTGIPIIDASNAIAGFLSSASYININGFKFVNAPMPTQAGITGGIIITDAIGYTITNNIFYNNGVSGIMAFSLLDSTIANNTIDTSVGGILFTSDNATIENNIITNCEYGIVVDPYGEPTSVEQTIADLSNTKMADILTNIAKISSPSYSTENEVIADYNLLYNNGANYDGVTQGTHDILANPKYVSQSAHNFNLQPDSPGINSGATLENVLQDIVQIPRPQGSNYDIGAYEYYPLSIALTPLSPNPTTNTRPTFSGSATTVSGANIKKIYYSLDGGSWSTSGVKPSDGSFNSRQEGFKITLPTYLRSGDHTMKVKAEDTNGSISNISQDAFIIRIVYATTTSTTTETTIEEPSEEVVDETPTVNNQSQNKNSNDSLDKEGHPNTQLICLVLILCLAPFLIGFIIFVILNSKTEAKDKSRNS